MNEPTEPAAGPDAEPSITRDLVLRARDGDPASFGALYRQVAPALYAWGRLKIRPPLSLRLDAEDVLQEVWCRAFEVFDRFDPDKTSFRYWILRVAKNVLLEAIRKSQSAGRVQTPGGRSSRVFELQNCPDEATTLSRRVARDDSIKAFLARVEELDEQDRQLFIHCGLEQRTYAEVATRLDLNREAVAKRWQRLRTRLEGMGLPQYLLPDE